MPEDWGTWKRTIEGQLREIRDRVGNVSGFIGQGGLQIGDSGSLRMTDAAGVDRLLVGFSTTIPLLDGSPQPIFYVRDALGTLRLAIYDPDPITDGYQPVVWVYDHLGHVAFTTDINGGVAEPWIPVPVYATAYPSTFLDSLGTDLTVPASACNGSAIWEGRIGKVSHPRIMFDGAFGRVTGVSAVPTYTFVVGGTTLDSFSQTSYSAAARGPFDISSKIGQTSVMVQLTVTATGTGTDRIAAQPHAVYLRQT